MSSSINNNKAPVAMMAPPQKNMPMYMAVSEVEVESEAPTDASPEVKPQPSKKKPPAPQKHGKEGPLSPLVLAVKSILGDEDRFNKLRAKLIGLHTNVIESFVVNNSETSFGQAVLQRLFQMADRDDDGSLEADELKDFFQNKLGFEWLQDKQVQGILKRADRNENGQLELDEWLAEAPKTLRTNLIKLAKKNGGELGLLV